jgi:hypothetical protein
MSYEFYAGFNPHKSEQTMTKEQALDNCTRAIAEVTITGRALAAAKVKLAEATVTMTVNPNELLQAIVALTTLSRADEAEQRASKQLAEALEDLHTVCKGVQGAQL